MKNLLSIFFMCIFIQSGISAILVDKNSPTEILGSFKLGSFHLTEMESDHGKVTTVSFGDENSRVLLRNKGNILLPVESFHIGTPLNGSIDVKFSPSKVRKVTLSFPLENSVGDTLLDTYEGKKFVQQFISVPEYSFRRGLRCASIAIKPFVYEASTKTLTIVEEAQFSIHFPKNKNRSTPRTNVKGDYEQMVKSLLLNYDIAQSWKKMRNLPPKSFRGDHPFSDVNGAITFTIGDGISGTNETTLNENGIIKILASEIIPHFDHSVSVNTIGLFASIRNEIDTLTPGINAINDGVISVPIFMNDSNNNGLFDSHDYFLAPVSSINYWRYYSDTGVYNYNLHRMETHRKYWITATGGEHVDTFSCNNPPVFSTNRYTERKYFSHFSHLSGEDAYGGMSWYWFAISPAQASYTYEIEIDNADESFPVNLFIDYTHDNNNSFIIDINDGSNIIKGVPTNLYTIDNFKNSSTNITIGFNNPSASSKLEVAGLEFNYQKTMDISKTNFMEILTLTTTELLQLGLDNLSIVGFTINNASNDVIIFRINADESLVQLVVPEVSGTNVSWSDSAGLGIRYLIAKPEAFISPQSLVYEPFDDASSYKITKTRSNLNRCDYLVVTDKIFEEQAIRLVQHKEFTGHFLQPKYILTDDCYRDFSGGNQDRGAIRNMLAYAINSGWSLGPEYVVFMGSGNYDYKCYKTAEKNFVPTSQMSKGAAQLCVDDFFSCLDSGENVIGGAAPDIFLGRIPATSTEDADIVVQKIIDMEGADADFSSWRNRVLLIADDDKQGSGKKDNINHHQPSETIEDALDKNRPSFEVRKTYLFEYEWTSVYEKPDATSALFSEINNGVSCVNYFGHGSAEAWADEFILDKDKVGNFSNYKRYPLISSYSCSVGHFDTPGHTSLSEMFVLVPSAGAIASIASTRIAYANANVSMAVVFYDFFFDKLASRSIGEAYLLTKSHSQGNLIRYVLHGDPSIRFVQLTDSISVSMSNIDNSALSICTLAVDTTTINTYDSSYTSGDIFLIDSFPESDSISDFMYYVFGRSFQEIRAQQEVKISGTLFSTSTAFVDNAFSNEGIGAWVTIGFYNPDEENVIRKDGGIQSQLKSPYSLPGMLLRPDTTIPVVDGKFSLTLLMPRRVPFSKTDVKIRAYAWNDDGSKFGVGYFDKFTFNGSDNIAGSDTEGPRIAVRPVYINNKGGETSGWNTSVGFVDTVVSMLPLKLRIDIWDEDGIEPNGDTPEEGLTFEVLGDMKSIAKLNIANEYISDSKSQGRAGSAEHFIDTSDLSVGLYQMTIGAMDANGNVSKLSMVLRIIAREDFELSRVYNYPNPVNMGKTTAFYFYHTYTFEDYSSSMEVEGGVDATIKIYTLSGRLVRVFKNAQNGEVWDLCDQRGNRLSPNVYLYTITVKAAINDYSMSNNGDKTITSKVKKLVIYPPR